MDLKAKISWGPFMYMVSSIAVPVVFFYLASLLQQTTNLQFIGNVYDNKSMIESIGLVNVYLNCTLMSFYSGLIAGIETLCSNALAAKRYKLLGYYFQRARIVSYSVTTFLALFHWITIRFILKAFKMNAEVTRYIYIYIFIFNFIRYGCHYCYANLVFVFFDVQTASTMRLNNVIGKSYINLIVLLISLVFHPLWNYIFVVLMDLDVIGSAISYVITK